MMKLSILTYKQQNRYYAVCPEIKATAYGNTKQQAVRRLRASLFFFLKETGYIISTKERTKILRNEEIYFIENPSNA
jgi:predicted RNase H-like HicB family nuclease